jgi:hypothetical protein
MTNGITKPKITIKDIIYIITLVIGIGSAWVNFSVKIALIEAKVNRNTLVLETYNLSIIDYQLGEMNKKLDNMTELIEQHMSSE